MVIFHFVFEIIKISILGSVYACLILLLFRVIAVFSPDGWFARTSEKQLNFWFKSGFLISISLFSFMFTYWGDHGLGDSSEGFLDFFSLQPSPANFGARVKLLQAPFRPVTINGGAKFASWYDIKSLMFSGSEEKHFSIPEIKESLEIIDGHV